MAVENSSIWGLDFGGTKIEGAILRSTNNPEVLFRERVPTCADEGYDKMLSQVKTLVDKMENHIGHLPEKIGIGTPGAMTPSTGLMKNCNTTALNGRPMKSDLQNLLNVQVELANDANCFALAETKYGVVKDKFPEAKVVFGVIMGTGVGGGLVVNGHVINGFHGIGGEWGHNYLHTEEQSRCYCGQIGCIETVLAGPALERYYQAHAGKKKPLKEIVALARLKEDSVAVQTMQRLTNNFARAISTIVNMIDPEVIVIGGGVGNIDEIYTDGVGNLPKHAFNATFDAPVVKPQLGDSAGVFGAALLVDQS